MVRNGMSVLLNAIVMPMPSTVEEKIEDKSFLFGCVAE
jgi:hypothetical protein